MRGGTGSAGVGRRASVGVGRRASVGVGRRASVGVGRRVVVGPGEVCDGAELGGLRGLALYQQRVALQGDATILKGLA